jgi:hypothetical protein
MDAEALTECLEHDDDCECAAAVAAFDGDVNEWGRFGMSPLALAALEAKLCALAALARRGADVNMPGADGGCLPLCLAARHDTGALQLTLQLYPAALVNRCVRTAAALLVLSCARQPVSGCGRGRTASDGVRLFESRETETRKREDGEKVVE